MRKGVKTKHRNSSSVAPSAETMGAVKKPLDVSLDRFFQGGETAVVTGVLQPIDIALGEVLVAAANLLGHIDILNIGNGAERAIGREHQILEAAGLAGSDVEDAADRGRRQEPHYYPHYVVNIDEIALLIAVGYASAMGFEQLHGTARPDIVEAPRQHAHHGALVIFIEPEHVEELHAGPLRRPLVP